MFEPKPKKVYVHGCGDKCHHLLVWPDGHITCKEHSIEDEVEALENFPAADVSLCCRAAVGYDTYSNTAGDDLSLPGRGLWVLKIGKYYHVRGRQDPAILYYGPNLVKAAMDAKDLFS